jgi:hypothetical protein
MAICSSYTIVILLADRAIDFVLHSPAAHGVGAKAESAAVAGRAASSRGFRDVGRAVTGKEREREGGGGGGGGGEG